jgi:hypothetical protein
VVISAHKWLRPALALTLGAYLAACADSRPSPIAESTTAAVRDAEREIARALLAQLTAIATPPAHPDTLLRALDVSALLALTVPPEVPLLPQSASAAPTDALSGCLLTTGSAATLSECELGDHVVDGTWSLQYPATHTELVDVFVVGPRDHGSLWIDARLRERIIDSLPDMPHVRSIDGNIEISLMWSADNREYALDASIHVDGLAIDTGFAPAAGSGPDGDFAPTHGDDRGPVCAVNGTITIRGTMSTGDHSRATVWLGPGCGDVQVVRSAGT